MRRVLSTALQILTRISRMADRKRQLSSYLRNGRKPWSEGYSLFKEDFIRSSLGREETLGLFRENRPLPAEYGKYLDERVVEYPWLFSRLEAGRGRVLDAGSTLNFDFILDLLRQRGREVTIATLEPEPVCFWKERVSYLFCDLRDIPFRDGWFDEVVSISVIEHIGMDNSVYSPDQRYVENKKSDFLTAVSELRRVTKPGGKVYLTVPYGRHVDYGWYQQFDQDMINRLISAFGPSRLVQTYYCYERDGWNPCTGGHCRDFTGFDIHRTKYFDPESDLDYDPDLAASSRAVAALELWK